MSNSERGRRTGQHQQKTQQAVMFTSCFGDNHMYGCSSYAPFEAESIDPNSPFPVPPLKLTYIVAAIDTKPWDIEQYVETMFHNPHRILIDYEVECDGCALLVSSARTRYIGDGQRVLCPDCEEKFSDQILETRLRDIAEEDSCE